MQLGKFLSMFLFVVSFIDLLNIIKPKLKILLSSFIFIFSIFGPLSNLLIGISQKFYEPSISDKLTFISQYNKYYKSKSGSVYDKK